MLFRSGETDGTGEGLVPYLTVGTWSTRWDVPDGNVVPLSDMDVIDMDKDALYENKQQINGLLSQILKERITD